MNSPRILLVADTPDWAFAKECNALKKYLGNCYDITLSYFGARRNNTNEYIHINDVAPSGFDAVLLKGIMGLDFEKLKRCASHKVILNLGSHHYFDDGGTIKSLKEHLNLIGNLFCVSPDILSRAARYVDNDTRLFYTPQGVDGSVFNCNPTFTIGWAGNALHMGDHKRFNEIIVPIAEHYKKVSHTEISMAAIKVRGDSLDRLSLCQNVKIKQYDSVEMPEYYRSIDVLINASRSESICQPMIEAVACGIPVITTDVGYARKVIVDGVNGMIVPPSINAFVAAIDYFRNDRFYAARRKSVEIMSSLLSWESVISHTDCALQQVIRRSS